MMLNMQVTLYSIYNYGVCVTFLSNIHNKEDEIQWEHLIIYLLGLNYHSRHQPMIWWDGTVSLLKTL